MWVHSNPKGCLRDTLVSCLWQIQAPFVTPSLCCEQMLNKAGTEWIDLWVDGQMDGWTNGMFWV